jgi:glycosyltransferase involved in cell wall biosynthesis
MRITYFMRCLAMMRGGGETQHLAWIRALRGMGVEIDIITGRPLLQPALYTVDDIPTTVLRSPYMRDLVYKVQGKRIVGRFGAWALHADEELFCRLAWQVISRRAAQPDLVLSHAVHQAARLRPAQIPVAIYLPGPPNRRYIADLRLADGLISDGWAAKHLPEMIGRPVDDVLKGVDTQAFTPDGPNHRRAERLDERRVVLCVTRLVPIKNLPLLIEAFADVHRDRLDTTLVLLGEGPQESVLRARAAALGVSESVRFAGYAPQEETPSWYRSADIFALSSDFDNSPNVVLEAMACGLPVVATDVGGLRDYIVPEVNGLLVPKGSRPDFAAALGKYLDNPVFARTTGRTNRAAAVERFSWAVSAARMLAVYERIIESHGARPDQKRMAATA